MSFYDRGETFGILVGCVIRNSKQHTVKEIAKKCGMSYQSFHQRLHGLTAFSADEIQVLLKSLPDRRLIDYLLSQSSFALPPDYSQFYQQWPNVPAVQFSLTATKGAFDVL